MSGGRVATEQDATVVRLETDDGLVGWGEQCVFSPNFLPAHGGGARATLGLLAPAVLGADPRQVDVVYARMDAAVKGHAYAKAAIDIACWDLLGKATDLRVSDLLGGTFQEEIPLYWGIGIAEPEEMRRRAEAAVAAGYRQIQLKVGTGWRDDVARVEECLGGLGEARSRDRRRQRLLDAGRGDLGGCRPRRAGRLHRAAVLDDRGVCAGQAALTAAVRARREPDRPRRARALAAEPPTPSASSSRSSAASRRSGRARDLAASWGLAMTLEDSGGGDIVTAAMTHLSCSVPPRLLLSGFLVGEMVSERIAAGAPRAENGRARLPAGPGLGIEVDEAALGEPWLRLG